MMLKMKLYYVPFTLRIYVGGVVKYVEAGIKIAATSEEETRVKLRSQIQVELTQIHKPTEIDFS